jgi:hypothetical protein
MGCSGGISALVSQAWAEHLHNHLSITRRLPSAETSHLNIDREERMCGTTAKSLMVFMA